MAAYNSQLEAVGRGAFPALGAKVGVVEKEIDINAAVAQKGSALAAEDTVEVFSLRKGQAVLAAGFTVVEAAAGTALAIDLGDSDDVDRYVANFNAKSDAGTVAQMVPANLPFIYVGANTLDINMKTVTSVTDHKWGKVRVWAVIADVEGLSG